MVYNNLSLRLNYYINLNFSNFRISDTYYDQIPKFFIIIIYSIGKCKNCNFISWTLFVSFIRIKKAPYRYSIIWHFFRVPEANEIANITLLPGYFEILMFICPWYFAIFFSQFTLKDSTLPFNLLCIDGNGFSILLLKRQFSSVI